jgi:hypothetical protein
LRQRKAASHGVPLAARTPKKRDVRIVVLVDRRLGSLGCRGVHVNELDVTTKNAKQTKLKIYQEILMLGLSDKPMLPLSSWSATPNGSAGSGRTMPWLGLSIVLSLMLHMPDTLWAARRIVWKTGVLHNDHNAICSQSRWQR